jgi:hypothetical protein
MLLQLKSGQSAAEREAADVDLQTSEASARRAAAQHSTAPQPRAMRRARARAARHRACAALMRGRVSSHTPLARAWRCTPARACVPLNRGAVLNIQL